MTDKNNGCKFIFASARIKIDRILDLIAETPLTRLEIMTKLYISQRHAMTLLNYLHEEKKVHIAKWSHESIDGKKAHLRPMYMAGDKKDKPRPSALTIKQINRRKYARLKEDPEAYTLYLKKQNQRHKNNAFVPRCDIAASWIVRRAS